VGGVTKKDQAKYAHRLFWNFTDLLFIFFFLDEKETKSHGHSPTPVFPAPAFPGNGVKNSISHRMAKVCRTFTYGILLMFYF
jgi:hypothetical protein